MTLRMFVWHRLEDFARWKEAADSHREAREAAGLWLEWVRQDDTDPNHIIFSLKVDDRERAEAFVNDPETADVGEDIGVLEGGYFYVRDA